MAAPIISARIPIAGATNSVAPGKSVSDYANYALMLGPDGLVPSVFNTGTKSLLWLPGTTALTGGFAGCLDFDVPGNLTPPLVFAISPITAIPAINLPADATAFYKLRAKHGGDVVDGVNIIQPVNYNGFFVLVHIL